MEKDRFPAKATTAEEQSDAIVVSFDAKWHERLRQKAFQVVIRKRIPKRNAFKWLYFHMNNPVSAICARARIKKIFMATRAEVLRLKKEINLPSPDIEAYLGRENQIGCYELGLIVFPKRAIGTTELSKRMTYFPPQSFFIVSINLISMSSNSMTDLAEGC